MRETEGHRVAKLMLVKLISRDHIKQEVPELHECYA